MSEEKTDIEIVQEFLNCTPERSQFMIDKGINVDVIRNKAAGIFDKQIKEAQVNFLHNITKIKDNLGNNFN